MWNKRYVKMWIVRRKECVVTLIKKELLEGTINKLIN